MPLVDLKRTKADKKAEKAKYDVVTSTDDYPRGLRITLGNDELQKLGNPNLDPEQGGILTAQFFVCEETARQRNGVLERTATLELRKMEIGAVPEVTPMADRIYPAAATKA